MLEVTWRLSPLPLTVSWLSGTATLRSPTPRKPPTDTTACCDAPLVPTMSSISPIDSFCAFLTSLPTSCSAVTPDGRLADAPPVALAPLDVLPELIPERSEEHTSELQSLMRNSYAVFCLKKK